MNDLVKNIQDLVKALEAGTYAGTAPGNLTQGSALQVEDLSPVMQNVTFEEKDMVLQKMVDSRPAKSTLWQFNRQLSYGIFGGSAQLEGNVGEEEISDYVRVTVPMCFYSHTRKVTIASTMVETSDGRKSDEREAASAALKIAGDIEFDLFRGLADFSNGGVFDGNPLAVPQLPNMHGVDLQVRQSDAQRQAQDLMFGEYGSGTSVVVSGGGTLTQTIIENAAVRSRMNFGKADLLLIDPLVHATYNKIAFDKERIILAGTPQDATGADLRRQFVSGGTVKLEESRFLSGKTGPAPIRRNSPGTPTLTSAVSTTTAGIVTPFLKDEVYTYYVTSANEKGESGKSAAVAETIVADGDEVVVTITHGSGTHRYHNVYRSAAGGSEASAKYIGRVASSTGATTVFHDLGNKIPGFVTGFLVQGNTMEMRELAPFTRLKLAVTELASPEAFFRFATLAIMQPRKNVICDNLTS
jgi:hypothetical protein